MIRFKQFIFCAGLLAALLPAGCSKEDITREGGTVTDAPLRVSVTDNGYNNATPTGTDAAIPNATGHPSTRTTDNSDYTTTFTAGDQIGVFAVKNGEIVSGVNNLCLTATTISDTGGTTTLVWKQEGSDDLKLPLTATYYAYYPYQITGAGNIVPSAGDVAGFFADIISRWTPPEDQSSYAAYTTADLMIATGSVDGNNLDFSMTHQMSLAVIELPRTTYTFTNTSPTIPDYTTSAPNLKFSFTPYPMADGSYRYLVSPSRTEALSLSGSYSNSTGNTMEFTCSIPITLAAAKYKRYVVDGGTATVITKSHNLQVGDFYMNDGSLISKDVATLTDAQHQACIGIVYSTDVSRIGDAAKTKLMANSITPHGLVMALTNASDGCLWGNESLDENRSGSAGEAFVDNTDQLKKQYDNVDGYGETQWIINTHATVLNTYSAFYAASRYGTSRYAAPTNTTSWFIPSIGQWWDIVSNLGGIDLSDYREKTDESVFISGAAETAVGKMNTYLGRISGAETFKKNTSFWSSSEYSENKACFMNFNYWGYLGLDYNLKNGNGSKVRCSFAF